ncbi:MAG TPA: L-histidine N(alpha)-methyltransferase [Gammaproteobacteria bacterium]|nr:L-histidine N(alpha)-methyltransferase [Gammaproteobacteria bacterium]
MSTNRAPKSGDRLHCCIVKPARPVPGLQDDVRAGLLVPPRTLPPKYFYDDRGSRLFDRICDTPEYYPTRTEDRLLRERARAILRRARPDHLFELGSGASRKTRHLLTAAQALGQHPIYWPFDVSEGMMLEAGEGLVRDYPWLEVNALVGDYNGGLDNLPRPAGRRLYAFLGGTLGNFEPEAGLAFLRELRSCMGDGDHLLLGADRIKDPAVLRAAYNDSAGITAEFNRNVLRVINRELGADFDVEAFRHRAAFVPERSQVEMYLVPERAQRVSLGVVGREITIAAGEPLRTEISRKFTPEGLEELLFAAGLALLEHYQPPDGYFSLALAAPA